MTGWDRRMRAYNGRDMTEKAGRDDTAPTTRLLSMHEQAYEVLRAQILDGRLPPGTRLNLRDLAAQLGISVTPARDAALRLAAEGLVEGTDSRGLRITQLTEEDIAQTLELRELLEVHALTQAGPQLTETDLRHMEELVEAESNLVRAPTEEAWRRYTDVGKDFHHLLVVAARNRRLLDLYERLQAFVVMERAQHGFRGERIVEDHREHVALVAALRRGDHAEAIRLLKEHLEQVRTYTLALYSSHI